MTGQSDRVSSQKARHFRSVLVVLIVLQTVAVVQGINAMRASAARALCSPASFVPVGALHRQSGHTGLRTVAILNGSTISQVTSIVARQLEKHGFIVVLRSTIRNALPDTTSCCRRGLTSTAAKIARYVGSAVFVGQYDELPASLRGLDCIVTIGAAYGAPGARALRG